MNEISWSGGAPIRHRSPTKNSSYFLELLLLAVGSELFFVLEGLLYIQVLDNII